MYIYIYIYPANRPEMKKISQQAESRLFKAKKHYASSSITVSSRIPPNYVYIIELPITPR